MSRSLAPIPLKQPIVDRQGQITEYFRLRWQQLIDAFTTSPTVSPSTLLTGQTASIVTSTAFTTTFQGLYRVSYYLRKTLPDGAGSSLTMTLGWIDEGTALTQAFTALALDSVLAQQSGSIFVYVDNGTDITFDVAYTSTTPAAMIYSVGVSVERIQ